MFKLSMCRFLNTVVALLCIAAIAEAGLPPCASNEASDHATNAPANVPGAGKVCQFCHVPHQDSKEGGMLWNGITEQNGPGKAYAIYIPADVAIPQDMGPLLRKERMCMSCHDGTVAMPAIKKEKEVRAASCVNWRLVAP